MLEFPFSDIGGLSHKDDQTALKIIYTQKLILECLKLASVSDRGRIIKDLFLQ
jgi:hypothetical protein